MSMKNIGLIGCGAAAKRYYVDAFKRYKADIENLYLVDKNPELAGMIRDEVGFGEVCADFSEILDKVDGVIIALPHFLHYSVSLEFLNSGVHVLCEKPLAESAEEVKRLVAAADSNKVRLAVNNTRRMFPTHREIKRLIDSGAIGDVKSIEFTEGGIFGWASATSFYVDPKVSTRGILLDLGPHDIDLICWWLGEKLSLVECRDDSFGGTESVVRIEAETSRSKVKLRLNRLCDLDSRFKVVGTRGIIEGRPMDWTSFEVTDQNGKKISKHLPSKEKNYPQFVMPVVGNFIKTLKGEEDPIVSGQDVLNSIEFIEDCYANRNRLQLPDLDSIGKTESPSRQGITLVTGATGFVGGRIVEMLHLSGARQVRAGIRQWSSAARLGRFPVDIVQMDLMNPAEIEKALAGVTEIIHCAKGPGAVNAEGTRNLLEAAQRAGVDHIVHLSTAEVYGNVSGPVTEESPLQLTGDDYNRTKIEAENVCWEYVEKGLPVTILRPSIIYGPFSKNWTIKFANMFLQGEGGIYEKYGEGKCNLVYVDDLVRAILKVLDHGDIASGQAFNICGPEVVTWNEYFVKLNDAMGLPPLKKIDSSSARLKTGYMEPVRMLGGVVRDHFMGPVKKIAETFSFADKMMRKIEHSLKTTPSPGELSLFNKDAVFVGDKLEGMLPFHPSVDLDRGMKDSVLWLRSQGVM